MDWYILSEVYLKPGIKYIQILSNNIFLLGLGVVPAIGFSLFIREYKFFFFLYSQHVAGESINDIFLFNS